MEMLVKWPQDRDGLIKLKGEGRRKMRTCNYNNAVDWMALKQKLTSHGSEIESPRAKH